VGVLVIQLVPRWVPYGLPVSAGVALYVAATDLVPEVNREPGIRMALVFFAGVAGISAAAHAAAAAGRLVTFGLCGASLFSEHVPLPSKPPRTICYPMWRIA
jgi:zinc transporter ZupT